MSEKTVKNLKADIFKKLNKKFTVDGKQLSPLEKKIMKRQNKKFYVEGAQLSPLEKKIMKRQNKKFAIPPERGPQPQGMENGRLVEPKLKKRKRYDVNPFLKIKRSEYSKTIKTDKGYTNVPSMYGGQEYNEDFLTKMYKDNKTDPETGRRVKTYKTSEEAITAAKRRSSRLKQGGFNPEGTGYDYKRAKELKYKKDEKGHLPTRDYKTGMILKGKKHETFSKGVQEDFKKGYQLKKKGDRYYTIKSKREFNKLREKASLPHVSQSLKFGGMGCPHREMGAKSDIQGVKDIQLTGKSFKGVK
jgi:hypothetical protein